MLAGIQEILIISKPRDLVCFQELLGDGAHLGLELQYAVQPSSDGIAQAFQIGASFLDGYPSVLVLGDNLLYEHDLFGVLNTAAS